jgi:hypothetical protein
MAAPLTPGRTRDIWNQPLAASYGFLQKIQEFPSQDAVHRNTHDTTYV